MELGGWVNKGALCPAHGWPVCVCGGGAGCSCSLMGHQGTNLTGASFVSRELIADNGPDPVADVSFVEALGVPDTEAFRTDIISCR